MHLQLRLLRTLKREPHNVPYTHICKFFHLLNFAELEVYRGDKGQKARTNATG